MDPERVRAECWFGDEVIHRTSGEAMDDQLRLAVADLEGGARVG